MVALVLTALLTAMLALVSAPAAEAAGPSSRVVAYVYWQTTNTPIASLSVSPATYQAGDTVTVSLNYTLPKTQQTGCGGDFPGLYSGGRYSRWGGRATPPTTFTNPVPYDPEYMRQYASQYYPRYVWSDNANIWTDGRLGPGTYSVTAIAPSSRDPYAQIQADEINPAHPCRNPFESNTYSKAIEQPATDAEFRADPVTGKPGTFWFHPEQTEGTHTWDFGDGTPVDTGFQPEHTYAKPGTYTVTHCPNGGDECATRTVQVAAPTLSASITPVDEGGEPLPDDHVFSVGDELLLRERVKVAKDGVGPMSQITPADGEWLHGNDALELTAEPADLPATLELDPGESFETVFGYTIVRAGTVGAGVSLDAQDAAGRAIETVDGSWLDTVSGLLVEVTTAWPGEQDVENPPEFQRDNNGDGKVDDADHELTVDVKITNLLDDTVKDVKPREDDRPIDFRNRRTGAAVAMKDLEGQDYAMKFGTLAPKGQPGASKTMQVTYVATGDVDAFADAFFQGIPDKGGVAKGYGTKQVRFGSHLALQAKLRVEDRPYTSGQPVRVLGSLTNLLQDRERSDGTTEKAPDLAVVLVPVTDGNDVAATNAAGGYAFPASYGGPTPLGIEPISVSTRGKPRHQGDHRHPAARAVHDRGLPLPRAGVGEGPRAS